MFINFGVYNANIMAVLLAIDKTVFTKYIINMAQLLIYLTIGSLSHEIWSLQIRFEKMIIGFISIHRRDFLKVKIKIYNKITIGVITKGMFKFFFYS